MDLTDIPIIITDNENVNKINFNSDDRLQEICRLQTATYFEVQNISRRLAKLERKQQNVPVANENEEDLVKELLPLKTIVEIKYFDKIITDSAITASQFKRIISKIGGTTSRDSNHRKIFINVKLQWLKNHLNPEDTVIHHWELTLKARQQLLKKKCKIHDYYQSFPCLKIGLSIILVS